MQYIVYQIKNNINGKIYIGCHKTDDINDGYMGSGKILLRAYEKYGQENFTKTILYIFDTSEEMFDQEIELVNESFIERKDTYNIKQGGRGGWDHINTNRTPEQIEARAELNREITRNRIIDPVRRGEIMREMRASPKFQAKLRKGQERFLAENGGGSFKGKHHTAKSKAKIGAANAVHQAGKKNSQYGTCWIHNNRVSKKIEKNDLNEYLTEGWIKGRKIKF